MSMPLDNLSVVRASRLLAGAVLLALPLLATAQSTEPVATHPHGATHKPASAAPSSTTDPHAMHGMEAPASEQTMDPAHMHDMPSATKPAMENEAMAGMDHSMHDAAVPAMDHGAMHGMDHAHASTVVAELRSADYSDGIGHGSMPGMDMIDDRSLTMLRIDQLEATHGRDANGQAWAVQGWYGNDSDKLWLRSEGERTGGRIDHGQVELLWSHAIAPFWDSQLGVRQDMGAGPQRQWAAFGIQGLAPYWFELEATAYVGPSGRSAARLRVDYELLFTQRLILQPEFELNLHGRNDAVTRTGRGLSDSKFGLRLRYEIRRELAPYIGVVWSQRYGATADYARLDGEPVTDRQLVAGVRLWF